jgi:hypothetical protein
VDPLNAADLRRDQSADNSATEAHGPEIGGVVIQGAARPGHGYR